MLKASTENALYRTHSLAIVTRRYKQAFHSHSKKHFWITWWVLLTSLKSHTCFDLHRSSSGGFSDIKIFRTSSFYKVFVNLRVRAVIKLIQLWQISFSQNQCDRELRIVTSASTDHRKGIQMRMDLILCLALRKYEERHTNTPQHSSTR